MAFVIIRTLSLRVLDGCHTGDKINTGSMTTMTRALVSVSPSLPAIIAPPPPWRLSNRLKLNHQNFLSYYPGLAPECLVSVVTTYPQPARGTLEHGQSHHMREGR